MKILLVIDSQPVFTGFIPSFEEACKELNAEMTFFIVDGDKSYEAQRIKLKNIICEENPNKLLCINDFCQNGNFLIDKEITQLTSCYIWFVDSMHLMKNFDYTLPFYSGISSFEPTDTTLSRKYNVPIQYVPVTAGKGLFCMNQTEEKKIYDVSFVGLVAGSKKRINVLNKIAEYCKLNNKKMICYGHFWHNSHWFQNIIGAFKFKRKYPILYSYVINKRISPKECASLYKRTKINLNIHIPQHSGFNCRTFEILGNENFELCDEQDNREIHFKNRKNIVFYHNADEAVRLLDYYLKHPEERKHIASEGAKFVNSKYKFVNSLKRVLDL